MDLQGEERDTSPANERKGGSNMRNNFYEVARSVYGSESYNMQPIAFDYVPEKKRGTHWTGRKSASHNSENRVRSGDMSIDRQAAHNG
jgi:hypothetical protein